jgi:hypothetical protein
MPEERRSWLEPNKGLIGPPIAQLAGMVGFISAGVLVHVLHSMGYLSSKAWSVVIGLAGLGIPFAIACEWSARRNRHKLHKDEWDRRPWPRD